MYVRVCACVVRVGGTNVDGVVLINLLHRLYGIQLPHYHMQPSSKIHALDNVVMAFNMLEQVTSTSYPFLKPASTACHHAALLSLSPWC